MRSEGSVVILGASYGKGWTPTAIPGVSFVNKGVAGEQSFEMLKRFEADVVAQNARAVIIWGFINDIFRTNRQDVGKAIAQVRENYLAMLERAEAAGIMPVLATEVTMGPKAGMIEAAKILVGDLLGKQGYADYVNRHVMDTNTWLRELALSRGLHLLDFENALAGAQGRRRRLYTADDGSHLTAAAYEALSRYADPHLRDWLQK
jgi:lysophospholipase L1-like esterase